jgi:hypothetical protein
MISAAAMMRDFMQEQTSVRPRTGGSDPVIGELGRVVIRSLLTETSYSTPLLTLDSLCNVFMVRASVDGVALLSSLLPPPLYLSRITCLSAVPICAFSV